MNFDRTVYAGSTYPAELASVMDTAEWRAVSYILTWYNPSVDNGAAAANQVAIWRILNGTEVMIMWHLNAYPQALMLQATLWLMKLKVKML